MSITAPRGATLWLTGLPSAGKTTLANALAAALAPSGRPVEILDGDAVRPVLSPELGYSRADRDANVARIGWVASRLARHGVLVIAAVVSPFAAARDGVGGDLHQSRRRDGDGQRGVLGGPVVAVSRPGALGTCAAGAGKAAERGRSRDRGRRAPAADEPAGGNPFPGLALKSGQYRGQGRTSETR